MPCTSEFAEYPFDADHLPSGKTHSAFNSLSFEPGLSPSPKARSCIASRRSTPAAYGSQPSGKFSHVTFHADRFLDERRRACCTKSTKVI
ncbi:hypothetical protein Bxe_B0895 [Paraburkholderia xenovorans LB400]|uniref:Uncharacterized protein n=1 Tax=Paraburkholderia xenovorans (strain LB400) TaxID=266265 RepID=Q13LI0_PARXL|nr:hypothetical protein Bxe_B0895 [Paraburkholderia xenovorans LB400]